MAPVSVGEMDMRFALARTAVAAVALPALLAAGNALAQAKSESPSPDVLANSLFDNLKAGRSLEAINRFFGPNSLVSEKTNELKMLSDQIDSTMAIYGPMAQCEQNERETKGTLVEMRLYLCQHDKYVTRWKLTFVRTSKGWSGAYVTFDDKIALPLDQ